VKSLEIVIPCYNEIGNLAELLDRCTEIAKSHPIEFLIVDNGSTDESWDFLEKFNKVEGVRWMRVPINQGYGYGIKKGLEVTRLKYVGWTHADLQTDPNDLIAALDTILSGADFVKGFRYGRPLRDRLFSIGMGVYASIRLGRWLRDVNAQPTVFSRQFYQSLEDIPDDFSIDLFFYYQAKSRGLRIKRFAVRFKARTFGKSTWNDGWGGIVKMIFMYRRKYQ